MAVIVKTLTQGFRTSFFRNQPVHQFYGHLQAVLKEIAPGGEMDNLFARPVIEGSSGAAAREIQWESDLNGNPVKFSDLPAPEQQEVATMLGSCMEKIRDYAETRQGQRGKEKDYSDYLKAVAVSPDLNQVFVINNKPVLVHWGFICEEGSHPGQGIYAGWDQFIAEIQRKKPKQAPAEPEKSPTPTVAPIVLPPEPDFSQQQQKPAEPENKQSAATVEKIEEPAKPAKTSQNEAKPVPAAKRKPQPKEKKTMACGLGDYVWVKWLAILLAIIILLLLLTRLFPRRMPQMPGGMSSGLGGMLGGGGGGMPGGGGGMPGGGAPGGGSGNGMQPGQTCPSCGYVHESAPGAPKTPADEASELADKLNARNEQMKELQKEMEPKPRRKKDVDKAKDDKQQEAEKQTEAEETDDQQPTETD